MNPLYGRTVKEITLDLAAYLSEDRPKFHDPQSGDPFAVPIKTEIHVIEIEHKDVPIKIIIGDVDRARLALGDETLEPEDIQKLGYVEK